MWGTYEHKRTPDRGASRRDRRVTARAAVPKNRSRSKREAGAASDRRAEDEAGTDALYKVALTIWAPRQRSGANQKGGALSTTVQLNLRALRFLDSGIHLCAACGSGLQPLPVGREDDRLLCARCATAKTAVASAQAGVPRALARCLPRCAACLNCRQTAQCPHSAHRLSPPPR